jgi:benzil reductase ((S)-benzoin forming)
MPDSTQLAIVTGTSSGIGAVVARQLLAGDWKVLGLSRRSAEFGSAHYRHLAVDLGDLNAVRDIATREITSVVSQAGLTRIGLVNNAATTGDMRGLETTHSSEFAELLAVNLIAPVLLMGTVVRAARPGPAIRIVNVSSVAAVQPFPGIGEYGSSKAALRLASMTFSAELTSDQRPGGQRPNVAVLSYQPGIVDTPMQVSARAPRPWNQLFVDFHAQGLLAPPDAPAREIVAFLTSDAEPPFTERRFGAN